MPGAAKPHPASPDSGRLNLLLSFAGWRSDSWADRLPQLLEPLGVHSLRARTALEAQSTIRTYPVHIAIVDLGIPFDSSSAAGAADSSKPAEEGGPRILELLRRLDAPPPTVVIKTARSRRDDSRSIAAALRCDAFAVIDRNAADVESMLQVLRRCLSRFYQDRWPS